MIKARVRRRDGRRVYDVRLRDPAGREYGRTFDTKKAAQDFEAAERTARRRGAWVDPRFAEISVEDVVRRWLESNPAKRSGSTSTDRAALAHAFAILGSRPVGSVTRADVQRLVDTWRTTHAPATVARMYSTVPAVFAYAEAAELIGRSPCRHVRLPTIPALLRPKLTIDGLARLAHELGPDQAAMMHMALLTSGRWAECAGLQVGGVDPLAGKLTIAFQLDRRRQLVDPKLGGWQAHDVGAAPVPRGFGCRSGRARADGR